MGTVCAWCGKETAGRDADSATERLVSYAVCEECLKKIQTGRLQTAREILNTFPVPILLLDAEQRILAANEQAGLSLNLPLTGIENHLPGEVIECVNARKPGGCGRTLHCQACALRRALLETAATGRAVEKLPAYQEVFLEDSSIVRKLLSISIEKIDKYFLLRIDEVKTLRSLHTARKISPPSST